MEQHLRRLRQELVRARGRAWGKGWGWGGPAAVPPIGVWRGAAAGAVRAAVGARELFKPGGGKKTKTKNNPPPKVSAKIGDQRSVCNGPQKESGAGWRRCEGSVSPYSAGAAPGALGALPAARGGTRRGPPITPTNTHPGGTKGGAGARHQRAEGVRDASNPPPRLSTSQGADFWRCLCYRGWVTGLPAGSPS